ncbi:MAG: hypothetical protein VX278_03085 [Myxococcota bacterium]|nr:hypothetical protein [Myxococcota bacterium]
MVDDKDKKVKESIANLQERPLIGHRLLKNVGRRAWERPRVSISHRLYEIYDIPDPFMPGAKERKWSARLGPVSLKLGENRRQPAPHLKPKEKPKPKSKKPKLPNVPRAPKAAPRPTPKPASNAPDPNVAKAIARQQSEGVANRWNKIQKSGGLAAEFGAGVPKHKLRPLPVRPDLANKMGASSEGSPPIQSKTPIQRSVPRKTTPQPQQRSGGRIRMKRTITRNNTLRETPIANSTPENVAKPVEKKSEPVRRTAAPKSPNAMSLDDLFGIPAANDKPIRLRSNRKKKD